VPIVQQASGTWTGTSFTPTLPGASSASNAVVIVIAGNTTVTTPTNWALRQSQVNFMGHYLYDRAGVALTSIAMTSAAGQGTWWIAEVTSGAHDISNSTNDSTVLGSYSTPALTPTTGTRILIASIASTSSASPTVARTISGWTNGFVEQADLCQQSADFPMQGVAILDSVASTGATAYSTTGTFSDLSTGRSAIIASYVTSAGAAPVVIPRRTTVTRTAVHRSNNY
jgi:hypothetical protein